MAPPKSSQVEKIRNPPIVWTADNRRLIYQLFTILEENSSIRKGIWPRKGEHGNKSKTVNYRNLARKLFAQETDIGNRLDDPKVLAHYGMTIKNQLSKLEKGFKTAKDMLRVTGSGLLHEGEIREDTELMSIWKEVELCCPWFYRMKNMVEDRFDDIGAAITNSGGEIEVDLMGKRKSATPNEAGNPQAPLPPDTGLDGNLDGNSPPWPSNNEEDDISDVEDLGSQQPSQFPDPSPTPSSSKKPAHRPSVFAFSSHQNGGLRKKPALLDQLTDGLEKVRVAKYERKRAFDAGVQETERIKILEETKRIAIREESEVQKRRIETEKELENRRLALQEREMALCEKEYAAKLQGVNF